MINISQHYSNITKTMPLYSAKRCDIQVLYKKVKMYMIVLGDVLFCSEYMYIVSICMIDVLMRVFGPTRHCTCTVCFEISL